jgi:hypothetical protein
MTRQKGMSLTLVPLPQPKQTTVGDPKTCSRCRGLLVPSLIDGLSRQVAEVVTARSWRCVNCGEWVDPIILAHRQVLQTGLSAAIRSLRGRRRWRS